jgi:hypothetical protein
MLGSVLPGLRELRAPLAAGYLWLLGVWLMWGDAIPKATDEKPPAVDRLYRLEPIITDLGLAIVASVGAYLVGSIAIDVQRVVGAWIAGLHRPKAPRLPMTRAGEATLVPWLDERADEAWQALEPKPAGASPNETLSRVRAQTAEYLASRRELLKTRLLDLSQSLHSEVDRPDAEATFRMALWPPLAVLGAYLALQVSPLWALVLVAPALLAWQWRALRLQANDALVTVFVARPELSGRDAAPDLHRSFATGKRLTGRHAGSARFSGPAYPADR